MSKTGEEIKVHPGWDCLRTPDQLVKDTRMAFTLKSDPEPRVYLWLNIAFDGVDVIEIRYDIDNGIWPGACMNFTEFMADQIDDSSVQPLRFIKEKLADHPHNVRL